MRGPRSNSHLLRWLAFTTIAFVLALAAVLSGSLDRFSGAGGIPRDTALQALALYWALCCIAFSVFFAWRTHRMQLILAFFSFGLALGFIEVAARVLALPQSFLHWEGVASRTNHHIYPANRTMYAGVYEGDPVFVVTNEDGLRTTYDRGDYLEFGTRVAILGDSFTFGFGVQQQNAMPAVLEGLLRDELENEDLAVLNAGIVGYSPLLERLLFEDIVKNYKPSLVILVVDPTDIGDDYKYGREAVLESGRPVFPLAGPECGKSGRLHYYGAVVELLKPLAEPLGYPFRVIGPRIGFSGNKNCDYDYYEFNLEVEDAVETNRFFHYRHPLSATREYFDTSMGHIQATARSVRASGSDFLLVISPRFQHWNPKESPENWESSDYSLNEPYQNEYFRYFDDARTLVDFPIFDLLPAFRATEEFPLVFRDDPHWNTRGNAFAARILAEYVVDHELIEVR